jgi:hypothetical protein
MYCSGCGTALAEDATACVKCGRTARGPDALAVKQPTSIRRTNEKYRALRIVARINSVVGYVLVAVGILGLLDTLPSGSIAGALPSAAFGLAGLAWIAGAELIALLIDIEANTRR